MIDYSYYLEDSIFKDINSPMLCFKNTKNNLTLLACTFLHYNLKNFLLRCN